MLDGTLQQPSKKRVGIFTEMEFLPVNPAIKRAVEMSRKALQDAGYEVVDFKISQEEFDEGKDILIGMLGNGTIYNLANDWDNRGEKVVMGSKLNITLLRAGPLFRNFAFGLLRCIGMGRFVRTLKNVYVMNNDEYDRLHKQRIEFCYKFSQKW